MLGVVAAGAALLAGGPALRPTAAVLVVTVGALGAGNGAVFALVGVRFPERLGAMTGLVGAAGGLGGFLLPLGLGSLQGLTGSFAPGFTGLALAAGLVMAAVTQRQWRRTWNVEVAV